MFTKLTQLLCSLVIVCWLVVVTTANVSNVTTISVSTIPCEDWDSDGLCSNVDPCPLEPANKDQDSDDLCTVDLDQCADAPSTLLTCSHFHPVTGQSKGDCARRGACGICCFCQIECDTGDACPDDAHNDVDSDGICGDRDSCPFDPDNDEDSDLICGDVDICPTDPLDIDRDSDMICDVVDSCLNDASHPNPLNLSLVVYEGGFEELSNDLLNDGDTADVTTCDSYQLVGKNLHFQGAAALTLPIPSERLEIRHHEITLDMTILSMNNFWTTTVTIEVSAPRFANPLRMNRVFISL